MNEGGHFPNTEDFAFVSTLKSVFQTSQVLGEDTFVGKVGLLTFAKRLSDVICVTDVEVLQIRIIDLEPFIDYQALWLEVALETAFALTMDHPFFNVSLVYT
jgi:hypothetical protein